MFGDQARTPGALFGGQVGYNWQVPNASWVYGVEADASRMTSDGTVTCYAAFQLAINATCESRPRLSGTLTGRIGYALGADGHTLVYGKGGLAWVDDRIDMAGNAGGIAALTNTNSQNVGLWGATLGAGIEQALTPGSVAATGIRLSGPGQQEHR